MIENPLRIKFKKVLRQSKSYDKLSQRAINTLFPKGKSQLNYYNLKEKKLLIENTMLGDKELKKIIEELKKFT
jgi:hypothetical protein